MLQNSGDVYFLGKNIKKEEVAKILIREGDKFSMSVDKKRGKI